MRATSSSEGGTGSADCRTQHEDRSANKNGRKTRNPNAHENHNNEENRILYEVQETPQNKNELVGREECGKEAAQLEVGETV